MIFFQFLLFPRTFKLNNLLCCCISLVKLLLRDTFMYSQEKGYIYTLYM